MHQGREVPGGEGGPRQERAAQGSPRIDQQKCERAEKQTQAGGAGRPATVGLLSR